MGWSGYIIIVYVKCKLLKNYSYYMQYKNKAFFYRKLLINPSYQ